MLSGQPHLSEESKLGVTEPALPGSGQGVARLVGSAISLIPTSYGQRQRHNHLWYFSSLAFSIHLTFLLLSGS